jgi:hypothetical protein
MHDTSETTRTETPPRASDPSGPYLEGEVVRVQDRTVLVELVVRPSDDVGVVDAEGQDQTSVEVGCRSWARLAVPMPYVPSVGDRVLVVGGGGDRWFVIGVLEQLGDLALRAAGDLVVEAGGRVVVRGRKGVALETTGELSVRARVFRTVAGSVRERLGEVFRSVRGLLSTRAQQVRDEVEGDHCRRAGRIVDKARGDVRIDGKQIHLG